jgi:hypothetical protein
VGNCAAGHQTKLFQFFSTLGKGEDEGEVFCRKYIFLFMLVDKYFHNCNHRGRYIKVLIKNLAIFFLYLSKEFLPILFKIKLLPKNRRNKDKSSYMLINWVPTQIWKLKYLMYLFSDVFSLPVYFEYYSICES